MPRNKFDASRYRAAGEFLPWNVARSVVNTTIRPHWFEDGSAFWYLRSTAQGQVFTVYRIDERKASPAFDHAKLAALLGRSLARHIDPDHLPFDSIRLVAGAATVEFYCEGDLWRFQQEPNTLERTAVPRHPDGTVVSPNQRWAVARADFDLALIEYAREGQPIELTDDGKPYHAYGKSPDASTFAITQKRLGKTPTIALWSPDSKKVVTHRLDEATVRDSYLIESVVGDGSARPILHTYKYPIVGDPELPTARLVVFDVEEGTRVDAITDPLLAPFLSHIEAQTLWWGADSRRIYFLRSERGERQVSLCELDALSGAVRTLITETSPTFINLNVDLLARPNVRILQESNEIVWFSERDGWGHLYLYSLETGALIRQVSSGEWLVREILAIDEENRTLLVAASGREPGVDPYLRLIYSLSLDGTQAPVLLTPEGLDTVIHLPIAPVYTVLNPNGLSSDASSLSPCGRHFIATMSRNDVAPTTVLRDRRTGKILDQIEAANLEPLVEKGFRWPETFKVRDESDTYDLYGAIFTPPNIEPGRRYPVIESIYPGPPVVWTCKAPFAAGRGFVSDAFFHAQALSELGFVVVTVDARGTTCRSKVFQDWCYGRMQEGGELRDHMHALRSIASTRPYMDLTRVGIFGHSGGGYASTRAILAHPSFYKVAVASASDDDMRGYNSWWAEKYQGPADTADFDVLNNAFLAHQLQGRLLIVLSDLDDNCSPSMSIRLIDALVRANKNYDLLLIPNKDHMSLIANDYYVRRMWDYFVDHLMDLEPPLPSSVDGMRQGWKP